MSCIMARHLFKQCRGSESQMPNQNWLKYCYLHKKKLKYKSYTKPAWPSKTFVEHSHKHNYKEIKWTKILHKDFFAQKNHKEEKGFMLALLKVLYFSSWIFLLKYWLRFSVFWRKKMHTSELVLQSLLEHSMSLLSHWYQAQRCLYVQPSHETDCNVLLMVPSFFQN